MKEIQVEQHVEGAMDHVHPDHVQYIKVGVSAELARPLQVLGEERANTGGNSHGELRSLITSGIPTHRWSPESSRGIRP